MRGVKLATQDVQTFLRDSHQWRNSFVFCICSKVRITITFQDILFRVKSCVLKERVQKILNGKYTVTGSYIYSGLREMEVRQIFNRDSVHCSSQGDPYQCLALIVWATILWIIEYSSTIHSIMGLQTLALLTPSQNQMWQNPILIKLFYLNSSLQYFCNIV